jgi:uncharacterized membrane protein (UPF0127 family)
MTFALLMRRFSAILALVALSSAFVQSALCAGLPTTSLTIHGHKIVAEVATTPDERATGLMNRFSIQTDHGMLFVFERPQQLSFWMKNTYIPLSIAFLDQQGRILNIEDMAPQTETTHWSNGRALYALEMRKGWFLARGIKAGDRVEGVEGGLVK